LSILSLFVFANPCFAWTERYVDFANGTDDTDCGDSEVNACATLQYYLDKTGVDTPILAAGDRINVEYDDATFTQTLTATIDADNIDGTDDAPIVVQGYSATVGDGTRAVIDGDSAAVSCLNTNKERYIWIDLELKGSTGDAVTSSNTGDDNKFINILITSAGDDGFYIDQYSANQTVIGCEITGTTGYGIKHEDGSCPTLYNYIHDVFDDGIGCTGDGTQMLFYNVIDTTSAHGISTVVDGVHIVGNTIYNSGGDNLNVSQYGDMIALVINNIFDTAGDYNVDIESGGSVAIYGYNCLENETTDNKRGTIHIDLGGAQEDVDPGFEGAPGKDFNIGANLDDDGYPDTTFIGTSTASHNDIGAIPYEETAGGGGGGGYGGSWTIQ